MKNTIAFSLLCCNLAFMPLTAQQMTAFEKVGQGEESVQEFFPGNTGHALSWELTRTANAWGCSREDRI